MLNSLRPNELFNSLIFKKNGTEVYNKLSTFYSVRCIRGDVIEYEVYREGYYLQRKEPREATVEHAEWQAKMNEVAHLAEIIIGKQRHGPTGKVSLEFEEQFTKFKDTQLT